MITDVVRNGWQGGVDTSGVDKKRAIMSIFRVVYRQDGSDHPRSEEVQAVECIRRDPWIVFLDPAGTCLVVRSEDVQRVERISLAPPRAEPTPSPPSDLPLSTSLGSGQSDDHLD